MIRRWMRMEGATDCNAPPRAGWTDNSVMPALSRQTTLMRATRLRWDCPARRRFTALGLEVWHTRLSVQDSLAPAAQQRSGLAGKREVTTSSHDKTHFHADDRHINAWSAGKFCGRP